MTLFTLTEKAKESLTKKYIEIERTGTFNICEDSLLEPPVRFFGSINHRHPIKMGAFSYTSSEFHARPIIVGRYCSLAWSIAFGSVEHPLNRLSTAGLTYNIFQYSDFARDHGLADHERKFVSETNDDKRIISIGNDVWIGQGAYIKGGVSIGDGAVIGAFSVVTKDVPPFAVVAGNPAQVKKFRFNDSTIELLLQSKWWDYSFVDLNNFDWTKPADTAQRIIDARADEAIKAYKPSLLNFSEVIVEALENQSP